MGPSMTEPLNAWQSYWCKTEERRGENHGTSRVIRFFSWFSMGQEILGDLKLCTVCCLLALVGSGTRSGILRIPALY